MESVNDDVDEVLDDFSNDPDVDNHIIELSNNSIKFEPVNEQNAVFYDESNRQVLSFDYFILISFD